jgi:multifunctional methyltransferase subunit TRM112
MRLLTHNFLKCVVKNCSGKESFPLNLSATQVERDEDVEFIAENARHLMSKVDYNALQHAVSQLGLMEELPEFAVEDGVTPAFLQKLDDESLRKIYSCLMAVHVIEGALECPNCSRKYVITQGIPNMLAREDEV